MKDSLSPIKHKFYRLLPEDRKSGARLAEKIGLKKTAYIFGVTEGTVREWIRNEELEPEGQKD